ncbi:hypothetical protein SAMN05192555_1332 [Franzmannia pantelleriensis]|uniref:Uncharacterized protein n=1 Tax=Franzmannia pantelleriensis TaxID=48727 RepID=A0A1G9XEF4_9GAMM|nr:sulfite exporter TauE/SafE family protein [Halomonas pantelleriensis]SDM95189.1 hypothetical protein SAMN05192555_1332 [Halomonas pantelleriensis]
MWFIQPREDYKASVPWKSVDDDVVASWQIRARNYSVKSANVMLAFVFFLALLAGWVAFLFGGNNTLLSIFLGGGMLFFTILIGMSMTHQTAILVYRFTESRGEVFSWNPQADAVKPLMKWTAIGSAAIVVVLILIDPAFIIASIGPVGLGIAALAMGNSEKQYNLWRQEKHHEFEWRKTEKIRVWRKRNIIALTYPYKPFKRNSRYRPRTEYLFCHKHELEERIVFFKEHLPDAKYEEGPVTIYS